MEKLMELLKKRMVTGSVLAFDEEKKHNDSMKEIEQRQDLGDCGQCSMFC